MTVYVDDPVWPWRGKRWCHMTADTHEELHAFARRMGLKRAWFQDKDHHQHYDLTASKHAEAVAKGATYVPMREYSALYRKLPIAAEWDAVCTLVEAGRALGDTDEEILRDVLALRLEQAADRALRVPEKRRRARKAP